MQYLAKSERPDLKKFNLYFSAKADTLPTLRGLDFDEKQLIVEANQRNDSITYWVKDTTLCERDTLTIELKYLETDTLGQLVPTTDTLRMVNKIPRERRLAMKKEADEKAEKERKKKEKKGDTIVVETKFLTMNVDAPSELDINRNIIINFDEPIESIDTAAIHMQTMIDSVWQDTPFIFQADTIAPRRYVILANWQPGQEYQLTIDPAIERK